MVCLRCNLMTYCRRRAFRSGPNAAVSVYNVHCVDCTVRGAQESRKQCQMSRSQIAQILERKVNTGR